MTAIIAGAGIGGLTAALTLHHHEIAATVVERAEALRPVGAGIQLGPNAMRILGRLGLEPAILAAGVQPETLTLRDGRSGRALAGMPLGKAARARWGAPYVTIHRADLVAVLAEALQDRVSGALRPGAALTGYRSDANGLRVQLADGTTIDGTLLVGADGIHSVVRSIMLGPEAPRFTGHVAWRAVVPADRLARHRPPPGITAWLGPRRHAVTYWLRGGTLVNFVGVVERDDWREEGWTIPGERDEVLADFAGWDQRLLTLIGAADDHFRWALYDRRPLARWQDGRAVLLGDACHPMLPFLAQGAAMAIEDSWVLAELLAKPDTDIPTALAGYQARRRPRTSRVQTEASRNGTAFHDPAASFGLALGSVASAAQGGRGLMQRRMDWLYRATA